MDTDKYHFISDNPSIYLLTSRLEILFKTIDEGGDAILQIGNLIAAIPPRLYEEYNIKDTINNRNDESNKLIENTSKQLRDIITWSENHKDQYIQLKLKEYNTETYQLLANKITEIIDKLYIEEEERKERGSHVGGLIS